MAKKIPSYGRKKAQIHKDLGLHQYSASVPLGNTGPTVVQARLEGGPPMPNASRKATGPLKPLKGKYRN